MENQLWSYQEDQSSHGLSSLLKVKPKCSNKDPLLASFSYQFHLPCLRSFLWAKVPLQDFELTDLDLKDMPKICPLPCPVMPCHALSCPAMPCLARQILRRKAAPKQPRILWKVAVATSRAHHHTHCTSAGGLKWPAVEHKGTTSMQKIKTLVLSFYHSAGIPWAPLKFIYSSYVSMHELQPFWLVSFFKCSGLDSCNVFVKHCETSSPVSPVSPGLRMQFVCEILDRNCLQILHVAELVQIANSSDHHTAIFAKTCSHVDLSKIVHSTFNVHSMYIQFSLLLVVSHCFSHPVSPRCFICLCDATLLDL